jgi:beta-lactamase class A
MTDTIATSADLLVVAAGIADSWRAADASGAFYARNIDTGEYLGFGADDPFPLASVAKVPLALVVLDRIDRGQFDGAQTIAVDPHDHFGSTGLSTFRHPATVSIDDLVTLAVTLSDNASADVLLGLVGLGSLDEQLHEWGIGVEFRHDFRTMYDVARGVSGNDFALATELALRGSASGGQHVISTLDATQSTAANAHSLVDLLERVWTDRVSTPGACARLRDAMAHQLFTHRLSSELRADSIRVSGKTGSFLNLRHEIGVVESGDGSRVAMAALTRSSLAAVTQQNIDLAIGAAARTAFDYLR